MLTSPPRHSHRKLSRRLNTGRVGLALAVLCLALSGCGGGKGTASTTTSTGTTGTKVAAEPCNGLVELCSRRLDEVVFPATHNSYAAAEQPGWRLPNQRYPIERQLQDGIRGLLLDVYFGIKDPSNGIVRTDLTAEGADATKVVAAAPDQARRLATTIAGPLGVGLPAGKPTLYLCHSLCELGAEPLSAELDVIARFLRDHRRTFLIVIIEDYVPPRYIEAAFAQAGLARLAVTLNLGQPLPTLGALLDAGHQLAVFSEDFGGDPSWYMKAFAFIQDTPLGAMTPSQLSCARARGAADSPLLMINDWIPPYPPSALLSRQIGRAPLLRGRIQRCQRERDFTGSIVPVDFYDETAIVRVARELNERR